MISQNRNDVVVTGTGAVTALGVGSEALWKGLSSGTSGIRPIRSFDVSGMPVQFAGEVEPLDTADYLVNPVPAKREKSLQLALIAAVEALQEAGLVDEDQRQSGKSVGVVVGSGLGPCREAEFAYGCFHDRGWRGVRPMTVPKSMFNMLSSGLSIHFGLDGTDHVVASACSSGAAAIGHAYLLISTGQEQAVLCGGADSPLCPSMFSAWTNLRVLARHEDPAKASRPFDKDRNGMAISEGAGMLVLESRESAEQRGAEILAEVGGYGASSDAHHLTAPSPEGQRRAVQRCLADAGVLPDEVDYINAHGTSTTANDQTEARVISEIFGSHAPNVPVSSTKSMIGHALGASGAIEAITCMYAIRSNFVPPTLNCDQPDPDLGLDYVAHTGREHPVDITVSNSFGFGGNNSVILLRRAY